VKRIHSHGNTST
ncbi:hypothetical protein ACTFIU_004076, partial [Dictyostelium citrinum]